MKNSKVALFFPGQGAFYRGALKESRGTYPQIDDVIGEIDQAAKPWMDISIRTLLFDESPGNIAATLARSPEISQVAIYAISIAVHRVLRARKVRPDVLVGHSFGEIAALVCGGAYSVSEGVEIVLHRTAAVKALGDTGGYMAALGTDRSRAEKILDLAGGGKSAVASENHHAQTVISGAASEMDRCAEIARVLGIPFVRINSPYPFHSPIVKAAVSDFGSRIRHIASRPLETPVFSPILNRYYNPGDALADCLAEHLVLPVRFAPAVRRLYEEGVRTFAECGALSALIKITAAALGQSDVKTLACLDPKAGELKSLKAAVAALAEGGDGKEAIRSELLPNEEPEAFAKFWAERGGEVRTFVQARFKEFESGRPERAHPPETSTHAAELRETLPATPARSSVSRADLFKKLAAAYAEALEYPVEVFTEDVQLEAELGIDSVKQTELLARLSEQYNLPPRSPGFRLSDYDKMGKIVDFVYGMLEQAPQDGAAAAAAPVPENNLAKADLPRSELFRELATMYAAALEYPVEVFTEDVQLEAELGIDSVKQTELLARVGERYNLPPRGADFRLSDYSTMGKVVDLVFSAARASRKAGGMPEVRKVNGAPYVVATPPPGEYGSGAYIS